MKYTTLIYSIQFGIAPNLQIDYLLKLATTEYYVLRFITIFNILYVTDTHTLTDKRLLVTCQHTNLTPIHPQMNWSENSPQIHGNILKQWDHPKTKTNQVLQNLLL